eukprot:tig00000204_g17776.t1
MHRSDSSQVAELLGGLAVRGGTPRAVPAPVRLTPAVGGAPRGPAAAASPRDAAQPPSPIGRGGAVAAAYGRVSAPAQRPSERRDAAAAFQQPRALAVARRTEPLPPSPTGAERAGPPLPRGRAAGGAGGGALLVPILPARVSVPASSSSPSAAVNAAVGRRSAGPSSSSSSRAPAAPAPPSSRAPRAGPSRLARNPEARVAFTGRSNYDLSFLQDMYSDDFGDPDDRPERLDEEWEAYWQWASAGGEGEGGLPGDEAEWTYERLLALDERIERNNGLRVADFQRLRRARFDEPARPLVGGECAVCLEAYRGGEMLRVLPCSHAFHEECLKPWFKNEHTCPNCRRDLRSPEEGGAGGPSAP